MSFDGPLALWATAEGRDALLEPGRDDGFDGYQVSPPQRVAIARYSPESAALQSAVVVDLPVSYPILQSLPDGELLVVGARCEWTVSGAEKNALVFGADGALRRSGTFGDGIQHVLTDVEGRVWVGYFDEGIFGSAGWNSPGPQPLGSHGIVRWSSEFERLWQYEPVDGFWLADCYALNVGAERVWACPYTDFPILEIDNDRSVLRPTDDVSGPRGIVVAGDSVGIIGDYSEPGMLRVGSLRDSSDRLTRHELRMPNGEPLQRSELICRDSLAHFFVGTEWLTFDLADTFG